MATTVTLVSGETTATLPAPITGYPSRTQLRQVLGRTADGTIYTYDKGITTYDLQLAFESLTTAQKEALESFFRSTVSGVTTTFTYTDATGQAYTARFLDTDLAFVRIVANVWDVRFTLEISASGK